MLLRMKVLLVVCLCVVPAVARPSGGPSSIRAARPKISALPTSSITTSNNNNNKRATATQRWKHIGPRSSSIFRVINVSKSSTSTKNFDNINDIPEKTLVLFSAPALRTKEARQLDFFAGSPEISISPHIQRILYEIPFFDTIDHAKLITTLQQRRKLAKLPPHVLKSLRPYFPFFSYE